MAFHKRAMQVIKTKLIHDYGKRSFRTVSKKFSEIKHEGVSSKETHFGFETVKESEKAEKGMTGQIGFNTSNCICVA
jgi:hypothetical protein